MYNSKFDNIVSIYVCVHIYSIFKLIIFFKAGLYNLKYTCLFCQQLIHALKINRIM